MNDLFLRECRGEPTPRRPVWMMRQAGRYMAEYRAIRAETDFLTLCKTPELAAEVTMQPITALGVDAAILFADILLPLEAMGAELKFVKGDGPTFPDPVRQRSDLSRLIAPSVEDRLGYVFDAVRAVRGRLASLDDPVPLIGFGGAPWTLAAYVVEGGGSQHFPHLLAWSYRDPEGLDQLLDHIAEVSIDYLLGQVEAGAQALQIFDTWAGLLDLDRWQRFAAPPLIKILQAVSGAGVPLIYFAKGGGHLLRGMAELPVDVLSVDWRLPLSQVREIVGPRVSLQGNLDPTSLLGPPEELRNRVINLLDQGRNRAQGTERTGGHIVNLGHGILPMTPVENAKAFVDAVKILSASAPTEGASS